jgi:hypothetical protein
VISPPSRRRGGATGAMPPLHTYVPPTCRPVFEFLDRRHQPHQELEVVFDRGAGPAGVVHKRDQDALWPKRQGFNVLATRKPML